jgi:hypothetical protein
MSARARPRAAALWLLGIQLAIVCSIAGKYLYERVACPRIWVQVEPYDPEMLLRGRYYAFTPLVDACTLPHDKDAISHFATWRNGVQKIEPSWTWRVTTHAQNGKLAVADARHVLPKSETSEVSYTDGHDCAKATLRPSIDFFVPENAKPDLPLALPRVRGEQSRPSQDAIWLEVTVPPVGPPRAIQLATNISGNWKVLKLR